MAGSKSTKSRGARAATRPASKVRSVAKRAASKPARSRKTEARPTRATKSAGEKPLAAIAALAPPANSIGLTQHHLDYTTHDLDSVRRFYAEVLGFSQSNFDPSTNYFYVQTSSSASLGFMPPRPGPPEEWRPPREPALYFIVEDVDRAHATLSEKGVAFDQPPSDMPWGHRVAILKDPEGRRVCLAQAKR